MNIGVKCNFLLLKDFYLFSYLIANIVLETNHVSIRSNLPSNIFIITHGKHE